MSARDSAGRWCEVRESVVTNGPATGTRQLEIRVEDGLDIRILPDRGFDVGQAWWRSKPLAWYDESRDVPPLAVLRDNAWISGFSGGLVTTCGLFHIGRPVHERGLHGTFAHQRAHLVAIGPEGSARARISEADGLGSLLEVERQISTEGGRGRFLLSDVITNRGCQAERVRLLYHVNLLLPGPEMLFLLHGQRLGDPHLERAYQTTALPQPPAGERAEAVLRDHRRMLEIKIAWSGDELPFGHLWRCDTPHGGVLAVEPATAPLPGVPPPAPAPELVLAPGASKTIRLEVECAELGSSESRPLGRVPETGLRSPPPVSLDPD
ncbi:DUF4432 family protein [Amycolatopsis thermoflava]|uniref:Uncharacterized protein DUF4432 n=1 Tax=Amycolatopsis thermoflava TaxID=84480 RepID=A0A3N2GXU4_9PSEU|nr:uncharacterized protein DUF4432 [Amycolatopsis thermoflava]